MVFRRQAVSISTNEELQTYFARLARSGEMDADDLENVARYFERDPHSDNSRNRRIARYVQACAIEDRLDELEANGMSHSEAMQMLTEQHGHNSPEALNKWLDRNLRRPPKFD
jgi:hypothetical protein